jgi:hypothetical protein
MGNQQIVLPIAGSAIRTMTPALAGLGVGPDFVRT